MQERNVVLWLLVPTNQDAAEAIHPTMGAFHHPPSRPFACFVFDLLSLFTSGANMGRKAKFFQNLAHRLIIIAFVQTHPLRLFWGWLRALHHHPLDGFAGQLHIVPVRPIHSQANGHTMPISQQAAFDPAFATVGGISPGFFPRLTGLCLAPRPYLTSPSRSRLARQIASRLLARASKTPQPRPTPEIGRGRWSERTGPFRPRLSTGNLSARQRKWHRHTVGPGPVDVPRRSGGCLHAPARQAPTQPIIRPKLENLSSFCC